MLECAIHHITYKGEGILATVVKMYKKNPKMQKNSRQFLKKLLHFICREFKRIFTIHFRHLV